VDARTARGSAPARGHNRARAGRPSHRGRGVRRPADVAALHDGARRGQRDGGGAAGARF
ncbi:hypothetical protein BN1708_020537, partial [Verticillium longisporum]